MTFAEWLEDKYERACHNADESWMTAPQSYGAGFDKGYAAALEHVMSEMPYRAAQSPMERFPQENADV